MAAAVGEAPPSGRTFAQSREPIYRFIDLLWGANEPIRAREPTWPAAWMVTRAAAGVRDR